MADVARSLLEKGIAKLGLEVSSHQLKSLVAYVDLLEHWNKTYNLTAIRDRSDIAVRHILDSLSVVPSVMGSSVIDVGTGAGLPGIPIAVIQPEKTVALLDSNGKKTRFLHQVVTSLGLSNVRIFHARAKDHKGTAGYDHVVTRAFATSAKIVDECAHLLKASGTILAMKSMSADQELESLDPRVSVLEKSVLRVPYLDESRVLVILKPTPCTNESSA
ncbi:MAG: 16S rRNA (guanine(527)-N(7))-methyltransferase RsmG [Luminiphilus sp.]|nr:16S rRNA (guanine(527)-N(7))-methyltransferase RsmG [Luminiphilus sp.]